MYPNFCPKANYNNNSHKYREPDIRLLGPHKHNVSSASRNVFNNYFLSSRDVC